MAKKFADLCAKMSPESRARADEKTRVMLDEMPQRQRLIMRAAHTQFDIQAIQSSWQAFDEMAHLRPIHNEKSYDYMVALMNILLDTTGDDEDHPLSGLLDLAGDMVSKFEQEHYAINPAEPLVRRA